MGTKLNHPPPEHARSLVREGKVVKDSEWGDAQPSADDENGFEKKHVWTEYGHWHLGLNEGESADTKGRYSFPFGDFTKVHRSAVIAIESRAAQNDHDDIAKGAKALLELIDKKD